MWRPAPSLATSFLWSFFFFMTRPPPGSTLFPYRRSSDLAAIVARLARATSEALDTPALRQRYLELGLRVPPPEVALTQRDRKSTRLNSSHTVISYAVFCLKKKTDVGGHRLQLEVAARPTR